MTWYRRTTTGWEITLHVQPGAKSDTCVGLHGDALKLKIKAPPIDGRANAAIIEYLADQLKVPRRLIRIVAGESTRAKRLAIDDTTIDPRTLLTAPAHPTN